MASFRFYFKRMLLLGVVMWFWGANLYAQAPNTLWTKTYGGTDDDYGYSVQECASGGFIIAGTTKSFAAGYSDVYLVRTDSLGDTLWTKTYGGTASDWGYSVQECASGGFIIAGRTQSFGAGSWDVYLIRTDSLGDTLWTKTYGGTGDEVGWSVQECASGGFIIAGLTGGDVYLIRTDGNGDTLWTKTYGGTASDWGYSVRERASGGFIIAGETKSFGAGNSDVYLIKTDSLGNTLWTKTYGGTASDWGHSVQECASGGFIITGGTLSFGAGNSDVYLIRTDGNGDTLWTKTYGGTNWDDGYSVQECASGGFIIAGETSSFGAGSYDVYLIRTNSLGDTLWTKTYGGTYYDRGYSVQECASGGFIIAGMTKSFGAGGFDVWLVKLAPADSEPPRVTVTFPNGGEVLVVGDTCDIRWIATDNVGVDSISILYSINAGLNWDTVSIGEPNDSLYEWIIPNTLSDSCLVKILAYDPDLNLGEDQSDSVFMISPEGINEDISSVYSVHLQCTPNPFRDKINITLSIGQSEKGIGQGAEGIELKIYDASGRLIKEFNLQSEICNLQSVKWSGTDQLDRPVPAGVYFVRLETGDTNKLEKVVLLR